MAKRVTSIGGQALLEGILMVGPKKNVAAFCDEAGNITTEEVSTPSLREKYPILKKPFIRGVFSMVDTLRQKFDFVIMDAPPVSVVTDAAVIGRYVDGAIFAVRSDYAPADAVRGAVKKLQDAGVRVLGSVLTRYDMKKALKGSSYAYSYAYNYNYAYGKQDATAGK